MSPNGQKTLEKFANTLAGLDRRHSRRQLSSARGLDFSSNDFLGLSTDIRMLESVEDALYRGVPIGSGGSRSLRGNHPEHEALESEAAVFFGSEKALYFSSGYMANFSLLSTLPSHSDLVVYDELIHASVHDGLRSGKAQAQAAQHNSLESFKAQIDQWRQAGGKGQVWIVIESLYSMDGDRAPLEAMVQLANQAQAILIIDEAHATGVFGEQGRGLSLPWHGQENVICVHTCGKALGASGALVCAAATLIDYLINRSRAFIYSTAPPPLMASVVRCALKILQQEPDRQAQLQARVKHLGTELSALDIPVSGSQIQPLIIGDTRQTMALAQAMQEQGFDIRGIRPPSVPDNTSRLRISITLNVTPRDISAMVDCLFEQLDWLDE